MRNLMKGLCPPLLLALAVGMSSCASTSATSPASPESASRMSAGAAVDSARAARDAHPDDPDAARGLIAAYLGARQFAAAYEETQRLREMVPRNAGDLTLLGRACIGLGLFDQALACFQAAHQIEPDDDDTIWWLASMLLSRGDREGARTLLTDSVARGAGWRSCELLLSASSSTAQKLEALALYRKSFPDDANAAALEASLKQERSSTSTEGGGQAIRVQMDDGYLVHARIDGQPALLLFDTSGSGLLVSDDFATKLGLTKGARVELPDIGTAHRIDVAKLELGDLAVGPIAGSSAPNLAPNGIDWRTSKADVAKVSGADIGGEYARGPGGTQTTYSTQLSSTNWAQHYDGVFGPDLLPGYSFRIDRLHEALELYPPGVSLPAPGAGSVSVPYLQLNRQILVDAVIRDRAGSTSLKAKVALDSELPDTIYHLPYAEQLHFGRVDTTAATTVKQTTGYVQFVPVQLSEVQLGGAAFAFDRFWAMDLDRGGAFVPFAAVGRDILSRFIVTLDTSHQNLILELYQE